MAITRDFKRTIAERAGRDPAFAKAMLDEAATLFLNDEPDVARSILRDLVNATVAETGVRVHFPGEKRATGSGSPTCAHLLAVQIATPPGREK